MREEHGDAMDLMIAIKTTLDPQNIMNPDKMFGVIG
jgi:D-lactate dehydrogenase (cytochrome)